MNRRRVRQPTRNDVAERAGVSTAVVSYVVNGGPRPVAAETRDRVLAAIDELGYRPNQLAQGLKARRSHTVGLIVPSLTIPVYAEVAIGLKHALIDDGYSILLCETEDDPTQAIRYSQVLDAKQVDGAVIVPTADPAELIAPLAASGTPMVMLEHESSQIPSIIVDEHLGGYLATKHVLDLGHTNIGLIRGKQTARTSSDRVNGFRKALAEHSLPASAAAVLEVADHFDLASAEAAATKLLSRPDRPTALLGHNDYMAVAIISAARRLGLSVPGDLSVVGYDDTQLAAFTNPPLTTIELPKRDLGRLAGALLRNQMLGDQIPGDQAPGDQEPNDQVLSDEPPPAVTKLVPQLVVRESTAPPR